jgi:hypothetical protein
LAAIVMSVSLCGVAWADDVVPAPWRDSGLYTFQEWEFRREGEIGPDGELATINPGSPLMSPGDGVQWTSDFQTFGLDGYVGTGTTNSYLMFDIPNFIDFEPIKYIRVQINGIWDATPPPIVSGVFANDNEVGTEVLVGFDASDETFPGFHRWEDWHIIPNPDWERIFIDVPEGSFVNQVVIETTSVPEPASLSLLAMGGFGCGLMVLRRSRTRTSKW